MSSDLADVVLGSLRSGASRLPAEGRQAGGEVETAAARDLLADSFRASLAVCTDEVGQRSERPGGILVG